MEIEKGLKGFLSSIEDDETKDQHLLAFCDFCLDLLEEQYGRIPPEEEIDPRFVDGVLESRMARRLSEQPQAAIPP